MLDDNEIPEEIEYSETFKMKKKPPPPIDNDIKEELPVTESQEWKKRLKDPGMSKVIDETLLHK